MMIFLLETSAVTFFKGDPQVFVEWIPILTDRKTSMVENVASATPMASVSEVNNYSHGIMEY